MEVAILAVHSAVTGALVCETNNSMQIGSLDEKSQAKVLDWFERRRAGEEVQ